MRITRFSILIFILLLISVALPPMQAKNRDQDISGNNLTTQQAQTVIGVGHPKPRDLNASITFINRNISITLTSRLLVEDALTLKIHDNQSDISIFNYTIPTVFYQFVEKVEFYSQFSTESGLKEPDKLRSYSVFVGQEATTYSFSIEENGTAANSSLSGVHIAANFEAIGAITFGQYNDDQYGKFVAPLRPAFPNLSFNNGLVGIKLSSGLDQFLSDNITKIEYDGNKYPKVKSEGKILEWKNLTREPFDPLVGLEKNYDYGEIVFNSITAFGVDDESVTVPFMFPSARRHVRIDPWGTIYVTETLTILHTGAPLSESSESIRRSHAISGINVLVHGGALVTDIYDDLGSLNTGLRVTDTFYPRTTLETNAFKNVLSAEFRTPIYGGETYTFSYEYRLNSSQLITVDGNNYTFNTTLFADYNTTISKLDVVFELPAGATLKSQSFKSHSRKSIVNIKTEVRRKTLSFFRHIELHYIIANASFMDNNQFQIQYTYKGIGPIGLGHIQYVITYVFVMIVLLSIVVFLKDIRITSAPPAKITQEQVPIDKIETFFNLFRERSGAQKRIVELREKRKRGKLHKKDFDGQVKAIQRRIREINPLLDEAARDLSNIGAKYESLVSKVMIASQRQKDIRSNTIAARKAYKRSETPKDIYQKLMREYSKDLEKQETIINKTLSEMHELIQQYS